MTIPKRVCWSNKQHGAMMYMGRGFASDKGGIVDMWHCKSCPASVRELVQEVLFHAGDQCPDCDLWIDGRVKGVLECCEIGLRCTVCHFATQGGQG